MRRQTRPQGLAARWAARPFDIDPRHLPARFALPVRDASGGQAILQDNVLITPETVAIERTAGAPARRIEQVPVDAFAGVAVRLDRLAPDDSGFVISVNLHHAEPDLCIPLHVAFDMRDVGARWQSWARALRLPLLLPASDGGWREPAEVPGRLIRRPPSPRPPRSLLAGRRSLMSAVREVGCGDGLATVAGTEIIART